MTPWVTRSLTRLGHWLIRKTCQVQHNMSQLEEYKPKDGHVICVSFWSQFKSHTQFSSEREARRPSQARQLW